MRISDWSSDVCSSDLIGNPVATHDGVLVDATQIQSAALAGTCFLRSLILRMNAAHTQLLPGGHEAQIQRVVTQAQHAVMNGSGHDRAMPFKIGRASCRERVCQYV